MPWKNSLRAAPMSSSGFVPSPLSNREAKEYAPLNNPLPVFTVPFPLDKVQTKWLPHSLLAFFPPLQFQFDQTSIVV